MASVYYISHTLIISEAEISSLCAYIARQVGRLPKVLMGEYSEFLLQQTQEDRSQLQDDVVWTENIFELKNLFDITPQSDTLYPTRPIWLLDLDSNQEPFR